MSQKIGLSTKLTNVAKRAGWPTATRNMTGKALLEAEMVDRNVYGDARYPEIYGLIAADYTLRDLLEALKTLNHRPYIYGQIQFGYTERKYWVSKLRPIGVDRTELGFMPKNTVTIEVLEKMSRKRIRSLPDDALPVIGQHLSAFSKVEGFNHTVGAWLDHEAAVRLMKPPAIVNAAKFFKQLGFTAKDCAFIRVAAHESTITKLQNESQRLTSLMVFAKTLRE